MPLRAIAPDGTDVCTVGISPADWARTCEALRANRSGWRLPCCSSAVVAKSSKRGLPFFAHHARGECAWSPETEHHLALKAIAVAAARACGWDATTEVPGSAPDGAGWVADVMATRGRARVAVEIQWSAQSRAMLLERQARYAASGVRGLWLIRHDGFPVDVRLPAARVHQTTEGAYQASLPAFADARLRRADDWAYQGLAIDRFLVDAFSGRLRWGLREGDALEWSVVAVLMGCWQCGAPTTCVTAIRADVSRTTLTLDIDSFRLQPDLLDEIVPALLRTRHRIGALRPHHPTASGGGYLGNRCFACGAMQRYGDIARYAGDAEVINRGACAVDERWMVLLWPRMPAHWRLLGLQPGAFLMGDTLADITN